MNPYSYVRDISVRPPTAAQSAMERALLELYCRKELSAISVKELCSKASVARSTFYAYYNVIDDCMLSIEDRLISELVRLNDELMGADALKDLDFFHDTMEFVKNNSESFTALLVKRPDFRFIEKWKDGIKYHMYGRMPDQSSEKNSELILEMIASETIAAYTFWLKKSYDIDFEFVKKLMQRTISAYMQQN